jgi:hypothetical protein
MVHTTDTSQRESQVRAPASLPLAWIAKTVRFVSVLAATASEILAGGPLASAPRSADHGGCWGSFLAERDLTKAIHYNQQSSFDLFPASSDSIWLFSTKPDHTPHLLMGTLAGSLSAALKSIQVTILNHKLALVSISQPPAYTFACLDLTSDVVNVTGIHDTKYTTSNAKNRAFDARSATFLIQKESHGMVASRGNASQTGMCWAGGYFYSSKPWDASWDDHKDLDGPTRNSSVINNASHGMTVTGIHFFNVEDGPRSRGVNWTVQHVWGEYVRDDCIENDHFLSGRVYDSLFDGCYTGISTRSSGSYNGQGHVVTLENVLLRLHPMPYPYKWQSKSGNIDENGNPYDGSGIPYRHGKFFKYVEKNPRTNNHFVLKDSVFAAGSENIEASNFNLPHPDLIDQCQGVVFAWLADSRFPGSHNIVAVQRKFPGCITLLEGQDARDFWRQKVIDWHQRHPHVGARRKPANPGEVVFPLKF